MNPAPELRVYTEGIHKGCSLSAATKYILWCISTLAQCRSFSALSCCQAGFCSRRKEGNRELVLRLLQWGRRTWNTHQRIFGNPKTIIVHFEIGAIEALTTIFPNYKIRGCWFHLNQSILRKAQELGFQARYQSDKSFARFIKLFAALAVVPPKDVLRRFRQLVRTIPAELEPLASYFKRT
jgi:hypothetical protein